jgi:DNA-binding LytR/AlgR family response regulator
MNAKTRLLIVEDDMIIAANMSLQLTKLGYEITGIESRGEEAIIHAKLNVPDIILMDVNLKGAIDGIETVKAIQRIVNIPVIYITANNDDPTFIRAKKTQPHAFISKPINGMVLHRTISLVEEQVKKNLAKNALKNETLEILEDRIFIRYKGNMVKLLLDQINYIEADRNYCIIVTTKQQYVLTCTSKKMEDKLPYNLFVRVHRSYIVNISKLDVVAEGHVEINRKVIPLSKSYKEVLLKHLQTI